MPLQYHEFYNKRTGLTIGVEEVLFSRQSDYQRVEVFRTDTWGNLLVIDGMVMLSEKDEFVYHEMLVHVAMATHPGPERVLIIGGGDGGSAREVLKHETVRQVDLVEIDPVVIEASRAHLGGVGDFDNPKLRLYHEDGTAFVRNSRHEYDLILVDGSDPVGPAQGLFEESFFEECRNSLSKDGVLVAQTESPWVEQYHGVIRNVYRALNRHFVHVGLYLCHIPLYPAGMWSMMCASKGRSPLDGLALERAEEMEKLLPDLNYYNRQIHQSAFMLPGFVRRLLDPDE